uniref:amidohydrolase n=1 Tax=Ndongobacter massiliensis TaxID=1871025 RepID=UPI000931B574|nr:amidohydrolase [Ndongobacter massiliensis]
MEFLEELSIYNDELVELRRYFHQNPELGFQEFNTQKTIIEYLKNLGLKPVKMAKTGVYAVLEGGHPGKTLLLRADIDALPVSEESNVDYKSKNEGIMHACGHDAHAAMLLVAAKILSKHKDKIHGAVKFVFQPNEEEAGAYLMVEEGILDNPKVDAAMALHIWSAIETGKISVQAGPIMGAMDIFSLKIIGKGGHGALPQEAVDPILIAAQVIVATQSIQTKEISVLTPTIISFAKIHSGTTYNIIPESVEMGGTIRYLYKGEDDSLEQPRVRFERVVKGICETFNAKYELKFTPSNFVVSNDKNLADIIKENANELVGACNIVPYQTMAGEDFSEFGKNIPACLFFVGSGNEAKKTNYPQHHPKFNIDEDALMIGVKMHVMNALNYLNK